MRIAFVVTTFPSLSETFVLNQITGLIDRGHEVHIYALHLGEAGVQHRNVAEYDLVDVLRCCLRKRKSRWARLQMAVQMLVHVCWIKPEVAVRSLNIAKWGGCAGSLRLLCDAAFLMRYHRHAHHPYDIIQCHYGPNGERAARLRAVGAIEGKLVTMFHGCDIRLAVREGPQIYRCLMEMGDCFLAISPYNRANLLKLGFDPARIVDHPVGVDMRKFYDHWNERERTPAHTPELRILSVARLAPDKALHVGIQAFREVLRRCPATQRITYRIVGEGCCRSELENMIRQYGLTDVVTLLGSQDELAVREELIRADIFLLPSVNEALPVALIEAQACGLPVVASSVGSVDSIVRHGISGYLVSPGDIRDIVERLFVLITHPEQRHAMGRAGRANVEAHYNINLLNDRLIELYEHLLQEDPSDANV